MKTQGLGEVDTAYGRELAETRKLKHRRECRNVQLCCHKQGRDIVRKLGTLTVRSEAV